MQSTGHQTLGIKTHLEQAEKKERRQGFIMCQDRKKWPVRIPGLMYLPVGLHSSYHVRRVRCDLRSPDSGFTLIEVLLVVVIIAIAAMIVVPMASSAASTQLRSAANMIAADLEYTKSMAISRGQNFSVVFDKTTESYSIKNQAGTTIAHPVKKGFDYIVDFQNDSRLDKVDIVDVDFDSTSEVRFDYLGSPYDAGGNPLNSGVINLQASGTTMTMTITVEPVTGFVSISD